PRSRCLLAPLPSTYASRRVPPPSRLFLFNHPATTEIYTLSLHDALPISPRLAALDGDRRRGPPAPHRAGAGRRPGHGRGRRRQRSEEHTSELQSLTNLVCRLLLEKKKTRKSVNANPGSERAYRKQPEHRAEFPKRYVRPAAQTSVQDSAGSRYDSPTFILVVGSSL